MEENIERQYATELQKIKNYMALCPGKPKYIVSANTGVSLDVIEKFIEQGILKEEMGVLKAVTKNGRKNEERAKLIRELKYEIDKSNKEIVDPKSRLLKDLETRKSQEPSNFEVR